MLAALWAALLACGACSESPADPGVTPDPADDLAVRIERAAANLEQARAAGKVVTSVKTVTQNGGGFQVSFTDGSSILLQHADGSKAGVTPAVTIDGDGYWCVSYDGEATYERLADTEAVDGVNGVGVRVVVENSGRYAYELYAPAAPQRVIRRISTDYVPNPSSVVQSVVRDDHTKILTLTLANGRAFDFALEASYPTGIEVLRGQVVLPAKGQAQFDFAISPADARFSPVLEGGAANLRLALAGGGEPSNFRLVRVERALNADGKTKAGQFTATVEDLGRASAYNESAALVLTTQDNRGGAVQLTSAQIAFVVTTEPYLLSLKIGTAEAVQTDEQVFHIKLPYGTNVKALTPRIETNGARVELNGSANFTTVDFSHPVTFEVIAASGERKSYTVVVHYSDLPILYITTPARIDSKELWVEACGIELWNAGADNAIYAGVQMKGRGNSTWTYEKKPYAIKLDKKAEVLGMPMHKRWVLLANFLDHTCMRNAVAFEIARRMPGLAWTPRGRFVEVVMNGVMQGNYYLCEQIKVDENRVNITGITPDDVSGEALTGGYLLELDTNYDELFKFYTAYRELPVQFKDPDDELADAQLKYVEDYFNQIEDILYKNKSGNVFDYIDIDSFVDFFLVNNIVLNLEVAHPKSCYMNKDRNGKLKAGPVWDFDYATFILADEGLIATSSIWYSGLFKNPTFVSRLKERWTACKPELERIVYFIDETAAEIQESAEANRIQWPNESFDFINQDTTLPFAEAVARLKQGYKQRLEAMDRLMKGL